MTALKNIKTKKSEYMQSTKYGNIHSYPSLIEETDYT